MLNGDVFAVVQYGHSKGSRRGTPCVCRVGGKEHG